MGPFNLDLMSDGGNFKNIESMYEHFFFERILTEQKDFFRRKPFFGVFETEIKFEIIKSRLFCK